MPDETARLNRGMSIANMPLAVCNALTVAFAVLGLALGSAVFYEAKDDFLSNARLTSDPKPCGVATPDIFYLKQAVGIAGTSPWAQPRRNTWAEKLQQKMCKPSIKNRDLSTAARVRAATLADILNNDTLSPTAATDALTAEVNLVGHLCATTLKDGKEGYFNAKLYGDLVQRVSRAYLAAMPAFFRLQSSYVYPNGAVAEGCMNSKNPFHADVVDCPQLSHIQSELAAAGSTAQSALLVGYVTDADPLLRGTPESPGNSSYYAESMPRVDQMLYRLLALAVTAQYDHEKNGGACFYRRDSRHGAREICEDVYGGASTAYANMVAFDTDASRLPTLQFTDYTRSENTEVGEVVEFQTFQHRVATMINWKRRDNLGDDGELSSAEVALAFEDSNVYGDDASPQAKTCHMEDGDYDNFNPPPPTPPYLRGGAEYAPSAPPLPPGDGAAAGGPVHAAVLDACTHNLEWGLWDQARLFGLPDVVMPFEIGPREVSGFNARGLGRLVVDALYTDPVKAATTQNKNPRYLMRMWVAFRLTGTTISMCMAGAALGFYLMFGAVPLTSTALIQLLKFKDERTGASFMMIPPDLKNQSMYWFATLISFLVAIWLLLVDPSHQSPYTVVDDCTVYADRKSGGAFLTTDFRNNYGLQADWIFGWVLVITFALPFFYDNLKFILLSKMLRAIDKAKGQSYINSKANGSAVIGVFLFAIANITIASILATVRGLEWAGLSKDAEFVGESFQAEWFADECQMAVLTSIFLGLAVGNVSQRWTIERFPSGVTYSWAAVTVGLFVAPILLRISLMADEYDSDDGPWKNGEEATTAVLIIVSNVVGLSSMLPVFWNASHTAGAVTILSGLPAGAQAVFRNALGLRARGEMAAQNIQERLVAGSRGLGRASLAARDRAGALAQRSVDYARRLRPQGRARVGPVASTYRKAGLSDREVYLPMLRLPARP